MSQLAYQRLDDLLNFLILQTAPIKLEQLSDKLRVSGRTIRADIKSINEYISENGAQINLIRKEGYILNYSDKEIFDCFWTNSPKGTFLFTTTEAREEYLVRIFLTSDDYHSFDSLIDTLYISPNTLYNDLRQLRDLLGRFELNLINKSNFGYIIEGKEKNRRIAIMNLIFQQDLPKFITSKSVEKDICNNLNYDSFKDIFDHKLAPVIENDSDYFYKSTFTYLLLSMSRMKDGFFVKEKHLLPITFKSQAEQAFSEFLAACSVLFKIKIPNPEILFMKYIISENIPSIIDSNTTEENSLLAQNITYFIINNLNATISSNWVNDSVLQNNLEEHIERLLGIHTISATRINPILDAIKNNFPYAFEIALTEVQKVEEEFNVNFSEDEISYIALYFMTAIEKYKAVEQTGLKIAIICGTGSTLSTIIENKLLRTFPNKCQKIEKLSYFAFINDVEQSKYDLLISTIPLKKNKESMFINFDISNFERSFEYIKKIVFNMEQKDEFENLFDPSFFYIIENESDYESVLKQVSNDLIEKNLVLPSFYDDLKEREELSSTVIDGSIALPHPMNNSVSKSKIPVIIAPKGIIWADKQKVNFAFLMSVRPEDIDNIQSSYDKILDFMASNESQRLLLKHPNFEIFNKVFNL